ncbi:hypothetical protein ACF05F_33380 [Rhodococcus erythropolis]
MDTRVTSAIWASAPDWYTGLTRFPRKRQFPGGRKHPEGRGDVGKEVRRELAAALTLTVTMSIVTHSTRA